MGKLTQLAKLLGAGKKTYKAFGLSGKKAERVRDMIKARRRAPMVHELPVMDPDEVKAFFRHKFPNDPGEAARQTDKWISDARQRVRVTGGTSGQREMLRDAAVDEYRYLAAPSVDRKFAAGGTFYPQGSGHVAEQGLERLEAGWFPYASVRGRQGTGVGRHESFHLIGEQMYKDPELRKSMPLLWRGVRAMKAKGKGATGLSGTLLEELGARLAEVPRGGVRPRAHPRLRKAVGGQPSREKGERLLTMTGIGERAGGWPSRYSDMWLDRQNKYSDPLALHLYRAGHTTTWGVDKAAERAHRLVTIGREKVIPAAVLGAAVGVGTGIGKAVGPLVRGSEEVAEPDVLPTDQGHWRGRPWMWNFER